MSKLLWLEFMNKKRMLFVLLCLISSFSQAQMLAELKQVQGTVLVNHGKGFVPYAENILVHGDSILVMAQSKALVKFSETCVVELVPNSLLVLGKGIRCNNVGKFVQSIGPYYAAAIGIEALGTDVLESPETESGAQVEGAESSVELGTTQWILIGAGIGAGVGLAVAGSGDGGGGGGGGTLSPQ